MTPPVGQLTARLTRHQGAWGFVLTIAVEIIVACARTCGSDRDRPAAG